MSYIYLCLILMSIFISASSSKDFNMGMSALVFGSMVANIITGVFK